MHGGLHRNDHDQNSEKLRMSADPSSMKVLRSQPPGQTKQRGKPLIEGFKVHRVGLEIEDWVDERTWYEFGKLLQQMDYAWEWMVADWLAFGDHKYGDKVYAAASRIFGKAARTWEDYAYIARNVKISERSEILPVLTHKPVARFGNDIKLQRTLLGLAEQYGLSKATFEAVIDAYLKDKPYNNLLPAQLTPVRRARMRAEKERDSVRRKALKEETGEWRDFARAQAAGWQELVRELDGPGAAAKRR
jgi:hypothetical protein